MLVLLAHPSVAVGRAVQRRPSGDGHSGCSKARNLRAEGWDEEAKQTLRLRHPAVPWPAVERMLGRSLVDFCK